MEIINLKETLPKLDVAIAQVEIEIDRYKKIPNTVLKVIHGHGSHGVGGVIRIDLRKRLYELKRMHKIVDYIEGELLTPTRLTEKNYPTKVYNQIYLDEDMLRLNPGVTFIIVNR